MNLPNSLTMARLVFCVALVVSLQLAPPFRGSLAVGFFLIASLTDWLDGKLARRWNQVTDFGKLMDPLADKVMVSAAYIGLIEHQLVPSWFAIAIVTREFLITGLRGLAASKGVVLAAEKSGKHKTATQVIVAIVALLILAFRDWNYELLWQERLHDFALIPLMWLALILTLYSGAAYYLKNKRLLF